MPSPGPVVCETVYESECSTSYHEHEVEEDVPDCRMMQVTKLPKHCLLCQYIRGECCLSYYYYGTVTHAG